MSKQTKHGFLAGLCASVTALDVCFLISTSDSRCWLFGAFAMVIGGLLTVDQLEKAEVLK